MTEEIMPNTIVDEVTGTASQIINEIKRLIREGNARRLIIKNKDDKVLLETPLTAGVAGTAAMGMMAPVISAIGMFAMFLNDVHVLVERYPEEEEKNDEYEVDAEIIDIEDGDEESSEEK